MTDRIGEKAPLPEGARAAARPMSEDERGERERLIARVEALKREGVCPTCRNMQEGGVYPPAASRTFYEDGLVAQLRARMARQGS